MSSQRQDGDAILKSTPFIREQSTEVMYLSGSLLLNSASAK